jgi:predicted nucleic acid-binding protein
LKIFIDTGVFVAFHNKSDARHSLAKGIMGSIARGDYGAAYTSEYIFDEAVTFTLSRTGNHALAESLGATILGEKRRPFAKILNIEVTTFGGAWTLFRRFSDSTLSFTDCTSLTLMKTYGIDMIASFDSGFDAFAKRIC